MKTRKILAILFFFLLPGFCLAQFSDDFSDGDFTLNPPWQGDQSKFSITTTRMRLSAPAVAATAYLTTPNVAIHNAIWEVFVQMDFTPSSTNYAKIYLTADQANLAGPINGYFIKVGNTSREVSLYRQSGASETEIIDGLDDRLNVALVKLRIKVTRSAAGEWQLLSDIGLTGTYLSEGNVADQTHTVSSFFGVQCIYTATRSDKFWFDDFVVSGTAVPDTTPQNEDTVWV